MRSFPPGGSAIVVGATGGIGRACVETLRARGAFSRVHALGRTSAPPLDLTDEATIEALAARMAAEGEEIRLVLCCAGFLHGPDRGGRVHAPETSLNAIDPSHMAHAFAINATGPALLMKHLLPLLPRGGRAVFAALSARVGSIGDNRLGGWHAYRASKAALNQIVRTASIELARRRPEAILVALHPGTTDTALSGRFAKGGLDVRSPERAAEELLAVLDTLTPARSGTFLDHNGTPVPW